MNDIPYFNKVLYIVCLVAILVLWIDLAIWRP